MKNKIKKVLKYIFYYVIYFISNMFFYRPEYEISKEKFEIHKIDVDPWPSFPHMHSLDGDLVLNIYNGSIYNKIIRQEVFTARKKDMIKLWNDRKFLEIVLDARKNKITNVGNLEEIPYQWIDDGTREWMNEYESNT